MAIVVVHNGIQLRLHCPCPQPSSLSADRPMEYSNDYGKTWKRLEPEDTVALREHVIVRKPEP